MGFRDQMSPFHTVPYTAVWLGAAPGEKTFNLMKTKTVFPTQGPRLWLRVEKS